MFKFFQCTAVEAASSRLINAAGSRFYNVVAVRQKKGSETVAENMGRDMLVYTRFLHRLRHFPPYGSVVDMMPSHFPGARVPGYFRRGKHVLPSPLARRVRILSVQRVRHVNAAETAVQVLFVLLFDYIQMPCRFGLQ